jgi:hypothetical protein
MKFQTLAASTAAAFAILGLSAQAQERDQKATINLICGKETPDDTYYSEIALNEADGIATFVRRSRGRTVGPHRMSAIFTPTEVQFENVSGGRVRTKEVFVISRVDLTLTRWLEASFSQAEPSKAVIQCSLAPTPETRAF